MADAFAILGSLHDASDRAFADTIGSPAAERLAGAGVFVMELEKWRLALGERPECKLFDVAHGEYVISMLSAAQGQYRNAFKGLRLVLELELQGILLSTDVLALREWLANSRDTTWAVLKGPEGVFGERFCKAFFPAMSEKANAVREQAANLYRQLSECIHGNVPVAIPLPEAIAYDGPSLNLWIDKAAAVRRVVHFALALRYLLDLGEARRGLETILYDVLGDIGEIRSIYGGRTS